MMKQNGKFREEIVRLLEVLLVKEIQTKELAEAVMEQIETIK